jgi:hypothetical protein
MPKVTVEGGATNADEPLLCADCGAQVAQGAPACPECRSANYVTPDAGEAPEPTEEVPAPDTEPDDGEAAAVEPQVPDATPGPAPAMPPRTPPRRAEQ